MKRRRAPAPPSVAHEAERPRDLLQDRPEPADMARRLTAKQRGALRITSPTHFRPLPTGATRRVLNDLESLGLIRRDGDGDVTVTDYGLAVRRALERTA